MYHQRFEMPLVEVPPQQNPFEITFVKPEPKPLPESKPVPASSPNTPLPNRPPPLFHTDTLTAVTTDAAPTTSPAVTLTEVVERPVHPTPVAGPAATAAPVILNPSWARQPSAEQMIRAYPERAISAGMSGSAWLNCLVLPSGAVTDCNLMRETPGGYGFGRAAHGLSRHFRINPRTVNGAAEGSRVNINLHFNLPAD